MKDGLINEEDSQSSAAGPLHGVGVGNEPGRRYEVLFGGDGFIGTETHISPKFSFSSDFGHFFWKWWKMQNFHMCQEKRYWNIIISWGGGDIPRWFFYCGGRIPPSPPPRFRRPWERMASTPKCAVSNITSLDATCKRLPLDRFCTKPSERLQSDYFSGENISMHGYTKVRNYTHIRVYLWW